MREDWKKVKKKHEREKKKRGTTGLNGDCRLCSCLSLQIRKILSPSTGSPWKWKKIKGAGEKDATAAFHVQKET